jgi:L-aminopeptidase/D-esterase-like protein
MGTLVGIDGVLVGHATDETIRTGCTVVICPRGATGGVAVFGAAPGTRETDLLEPGNLVEQVHAVLLTGGSAFGLEAATGVMNWLYEREIGFPTGVANVPIVPAAVLFDLAIGLPKWPDAAMGYRACVAAEARDATWGRVGAGTGATVGKILGQGLASPGGVGVARMVLPDGTVVAAVVAVNAVGHIVDPRTETILAGPRMPDGSFGDTVKILLGGADGPLLTPGISTTIGCIVTTARLDKAGCCRVARTAHDGLARVIRPVHTQYDGDTLFTLATSTSDKPLADVTVIGVAASEVVVEAVLNAISHRTGPVR